MLMGLQAPDQWESSLDNPRPMRVDQTVRTILTPALLPADRSVWLSPSRSVWLSPGSPAPRCLRRSARRCVRTSSGVRSVRIITNTPNLSRLLSLSFHLLPQPQSLLQLRPEKAQWKLAGTCWVFSGRGTASRLTLQPSRSPTEPSNHWRPAVVTQLLINN